MYRPTINDETYFLSHHTKPFHAKWIHESISASLNWQLCRLQSSLPDIGFVDGALAKKHRTVTWLHHPGNQANKLSILQVHQRNLPRLPQPEEKRRDLERGRKSGLACSIHNQGVTQYEAICQDLFSELCKSSGGWIASRCLNHP